MTDDGQSTIASHGKLRSIYLFAVTDDGQSTIASHGEANYTSYQSDDSDGLDANPWGAYLETDRGLGTAAWAATS